VNRCAAAAAVAFAVALAGAAWPELALAQTDGATATPARRHPKLRAGKKVRLPRAHAKRGARKATPGATVAPGAPLGATVAPGAKPVATGGRGAKAGATGGRGAKPVVTGGPGAKPVGTVAPGAKAGATGGPGAKPVAGPPAWLTGTPPAGWAPDPALARSVGTALRQGRALGELSGRAGAVAHVQRGVGAFYLAWMESDEVARLPAEAVRRALDRVRESRLVSSPEARSTEEVRYDERVADGVAGSALEWRHLSNETLSLVRGFAWVTADAKPRVGTAECVISTEHGRAPAPVERACREALASVAVTVPPAQRGALAALPPSRVQAEERLALGAGAPAAGQPPAMGPAAPGAGGPILYRGHAPAEEPRGMGRWIVVLGAVLIALAYYLHVRARRGQGRPGDDAGEPPAESDPELDEEPESGREKTS
jgi:hypothetical protein